MNFTALPMYRTCAEVLCAGHERNGFYLLDSDGPNTGDPPYVAYCDLDNNGTVNLIRYYSHRIRWYIETLLLCMQTPRFNWPFQITIGKVRDTSGNPIVCFVCDPMCLGHMLMTARNRNPSAESSIENVYWHWCQTNWTYYFSPRNFNRI